MYDTHTHRFTCIFLLSQLKYLSRKQLLRALEAIVWQKLDCLYGSMGCGQCGGSTNLFTASFGIGLYRFGGMERFFLQVCTELWYCTQ